jgi:hypothetical protein
VPEAAQTAQVSESNTATGSSGANANPGQQAIGFPELARFDISRLPRSSAGFVQSPPAGSSEESRGTVPGATAQANLALRHTVAPQHTIRLRKQRTRQNGDGEALAKNTNHDLANSLPLGYKVVAGVVEFPMQVEVGGENLGVVAMHVGAEDTLSIKLKDLLTIVSSRLDPERLKVFSASQSIEQFVSFSELRAAGIGVRYDAATNRVELSAD